MQSAPPGSPPALPAAQMVMGDTPVWSKSIGEWKLLSDVPALAPLLG